MRVALFVPCYVDWLAPEVGFAAQRLLRHFGVDPVFPREQGCCGQPLANLGCFDEARPLVRRFAQVFDPDRFDHVVAPSGSCVAMVREHHPALHAAQGGAAARAGDDGQRVAAVAARTRELCEFLVDVLGVERVEGRYARRVGLHRGCHALRELGLGTPSEGGAGRLDPVEQLLRSIEGLELAPLARPDECCGFGGTFAIAEEAVSCAMGASRLEDHRRGGAQELVSGDVSCLLHLRGLAQRRGEGPPARHVAELLVDAIGAQR